MSKGVSKGVATSVMESANEDTAPVLMQQNQIGFDVSGGATKTVTTVATTGVFDETIYERYNARAEARAKGYEGDPCPECGALTLVRNGSCLKCNSCGTTTGCS